MNLLLDEDSQGNMLVRLLRETGHNVETVGSAGMASRDDQAVLAHAKQTHRVLLTRNGPDFVLLHQADSSHAGIIVEHQDTDAAKNMTHRQITAATGKIESSGWNLQGQFVSLNAWRE